jgi:uncharacterized repeat protein (TIGR01451 family)
MTRFMRLMAALAALLMASCGGEAPARYGDQGAEPTSTIPDGGTALPEEESMPPSDGAAAPSDHRRAADASKAGFAIVGTTVDHSQIDAGGTVSLTVQIKNNSDTALVGGEVSIEAKCPDGRLFVQKTTGVNLAAKASGEAKQLRGPYTVLGSWVFTPTLHGAGGSVLATGAGVTVKVVAPAITNPLSGVAGYTQINLSSTYGSCGSHSGAVAIAYLKGLRSDVAGTTAIEKSIYGKVPYGPGESELESGYNSYMNGAGVPYSSVGIGSASVLGKIQAGIPVVAHVYNHYVSIYGLTQESGTWYVYFSDGATGYGTSGSWSIGASGHLRKMGWSAFQGKMYGGYISFAHK